MVLAKQSGLYGPNAYRNTSYEQGCSLSQKFPITTLEHCYKSPICGSTC